MLPIEVKSLKKHYGDLKAVDDISFTVKKVKSSVYSDQTAQVKPQPSKSWKACASATAEM